MQLYALITLISVAVANPVRRQEGLSGVNGTTPSAGSSCTRLSAPRQCGLGGDRVLTCIDYAGLCEPDWTSPFNMTDYTANQESCEGKAYGDACDAVWTCCPSSE